MRIYNDEKGFVVVEEKSKIRWDTKKISTLIRKMAIPAIVLECGERSL